MAVAVARVAALHAIVQACSSRWSAVVVAKNVTIGDLWQGLGWSQQHPGVGGNLLDPEVRVVPVLLKRSYDVSGFLSEVSDAAMKAIVGGHRHASTPAGLLPQDAGVRAGTKYINECCRAHGGHRQQHRRRPAVVGALGGRDLERPPSPGYRTDTSRREGACVRACVRACVWLLRMNE